MNATIKEVLTMKEALEYTGLSQSYMYKLTHWGKIPHYKPNGKLIYFSRRELEAWLMMNRVRSQSEVETKAVEYLNK
jgi:prophage regulatory protein